jgi:hypothetical protein
MPQPALHVILALRALEHWQREPRDAPFCTTAPGVAAFLVQGALAPDMGFFPGCDRGLSERVHAGGSSCVARHLLVRAKSDAERAFAWGWVTHVLADVALHPIVNAFAAELHGGVRMATRALLKQAHVRVEVGLDAWYLGRAGRLGRKWPGAIFDCAGILHLARALEQTYSTTIALDRLLADHRRMSFVFPAYLWFARRIAREMRGERQLATASRLCAVGRRLLDPHSEAAGFVQPVAPGDALLARIRLAVRRFEHQLQYHAETGLARLGDYDLETGLPVAAAAQAVPIISAV